MPIGFRQPLAAVRNAQLQLARERSVLQDQELEVSHQLADAIRDVDTNYTLAQTNFNRRVAAEQQVEAVQAAYEAGTVTLDLLLEAQRRRSDAEAAYYRSLTDYNKAIMLVHFRKGSLLEYNGVYLAEGPWPAKAYFDAKRRARARDAGMYLDYGFTRPAVLSEGPFPQFQQTDGTSGHASGVPTEALPEEVKPTSPKRSASPGSQQELPEPTPNQIPSPGPTATMPGPRLTSAAGNNSTQEKSSPSPAAKSNLQRNSLKISASADRSSKDVRPTNPVQQASADVPFEWGDLSLDSPADKKPAQPSSYSSFNSSVGQWKSTSSYESDPAQPTTADDRPAAGWKRAQR